MTVSRHLLHVLTTALLLAAVGCGATEEGPAKAAAPATSATDTSDSTGSDTRVRPRGQTPESDPGKPPAPRIVFLGDSLTAGLGLPSDQAYPSLLQRRLEAEGLPYEVVNAGVSGDTSAGGLSRLDWALEGDVRVLIVALGANDGLRGLPAGQLKQNLAQIIERARARGITVILAGMEAPPNFGRDYIVAFRNVYPALAKEYRVPLVPFLLEGVAGNGTLNQADGIHPTAAGAGVVADNVWGVLKPLLEGKRHDPSTGSGSPRATSRGEGPPRS